MSKITLTVQEEATTSATTFETEGHFNLETHYIEIQQVLVGAFLGAGFAPGTVSRLFGEIACDLSENLAEAS